MSKEIDIIEQKSVRSWSWPDLATERDLDKSDEYFSDEMFKNILEFDEKYRNDYNGSITWFRQLEIPEDEEVVLKNAPGCLICHNLNIPDKVHYAIIRGLCDIKTAQYYLFSKGIFFRSWYIKAHLKHIKVNKIRPKEEVQAKSDLDIINTNINQIMSELKLLERQGGVQDNNIIINLRKDLKEWMQLKSNLDIAEEVKKKDTVSFDEIYAMLKK